MASAFLTLLMGASEWFVCIIAGMIAAVLALGIMIYRQLINISDYIIHKFDKEDSTENKEE